MINRLRQRLAYWVTWWGTRDRDRAYRAVYGKDR